MLGRNRLLPRFAGRAVKNRLRAELAQYDQHRPWLDDGFAGAHIEWLRGKTQQKIRTGRHPAYYVLLVIVMLSSFMRACLEPRHPVERDERAPVNHGFQSLPPKEHQGMGHEPISPVGGLADSPRHAHVA
jgi:hypothetical protein